RIEFVILVANVEQAKLDLGSSLWEAITDEEVDLPDIVTGHGSRVAMVGLAGPNGLGSSEKAAGMIENSVEPQLLKHGVDLPISGWAEAAADGVGHIGDVIFQVGAADPVSGSDGPLFGQELVHHRGQRFLLVVQGLADSGWNIDDQGTKGVERSDRA